MLSLQGHSRSTLETPLHKYDLVNYICTGRPIAFFVEMEGKHLLLEAIFGWFTKETLEMTLQQSDSPRSNNVVTKIGYCTRVF